MPHPSLNHAHAHNYALIRNTVIIIYYTTRSTVSVRGRGSWGLHYAKGPLGHEGAAGAQGPWGTLSSAGGTRLHAATLKC